VAILYLDIKAHSPVDPDRAGIYRSFEDPSAEVLCAAWAFGDGPIRVWFPGEPCPKEIANHVKAGGAITGWGISFERLAWERVLGPRHGWPVPKLEQFNDTMAAAAALSLPREIEGAATLLGVAVRHDAGARRWLSVRRSEPSKSDLDRLTRIAINDVEVERSLHLHRELYPLSPKEREIWLLDQRINDHGIAMDLALVADMATIVEAYQSELDRRLTAVTEGAVTSCTQVPTLKRWLAAHGVDAESLGRNVIETVLAQTMQDQCREALKLWQEGAKTSLGKLPAADECTSNDGRARGLLVYHGARSGRWTGQLWQPQNLPRGSGIVKDQDHAIQLIRQRSPEVLAREYGAPLTVVSDCLRGVMTAAPRHVLMAGDYKNIEARITAWMAEDSEKLEAFRKADRGEGPDVYEIAAAQIYGIATEKVTPVQRLVGKTATLALGFNAGVDALAATATYHVDMASTFDSLWTAASPEQQVCAAQRHAEADCGKLSDRAWLACELTVQAWRRANPLTVAAWGKFGNALRRAVSEPETPVEAPHVALRHKGLFLGMRLPSGRIVHYPRPAMESDGTVTAYAAKEDRRPHGKAPPKGRRYLHGGLVFQHAVQGLARDLLAHAMLRVEAAGFPVVMSIHDEIISEVPQSRAAELVQFLALLCEAPEWAEGLPIIARGWSGFRYRKS
jgi:DNA polymerase